MVLVAGLATADLVIGVGVAWFFGSYLWGLLVRTTFSVPSRLKSNNELSLKINGVNAAAETVVQRECLWRGQVHTILVGAQASALLMVAVSLDRLAAITRPIEYFTLLAK